MKKMVLCFFCIVIFCSPALGENYRDSEYLAHSAFLGLKFVIEVQDHSLDETFYFQYPSRFYNPEGDPEKHRQGVLFRFPEALSIAYSVKTLFATQVTELESLSITAGQLMADEVDEMYKFLIDHGRDPKIFESEMERINSYPRPHLPPHVRSYVYNSDARTPIQMILSYSYNPDTGSFSCKKLEAFFSLVGKQETRYRRLKNLGKSIVLGEPGDCAFDFNELFNGLNSLVEAQQEWQDQQSFASESEAFHSDIMDSSGYDPDEFQERMEQIQARDAELKTEIESKLQF